MRHAVAIFLLTSAVAWADPPALDIPAEVKPSGQYVTLSPKTDATAVTYVGLDGVDPIPSAVLKDGRMFLLDTRGMAAGRYRFAAVAASKTGEQARADFAVVVGTPPPVPPGPGPGPTPPGPTPPQPDVNAPFAGVTNGLHVLIVWDTTKVLPPDQAAILYDQENRTFLDSATPAGPDGRHLWNMWPVGTSVANVPAEWATAFNLPRASTPWVYVGNGRAGASVPLPATKADFQALVNRYK